MSPLYTTGLFALSADPITYGHLDLIRRSAEQCTELIVLIANNPTKIGHYLFDLPERLTMTKRACEEANIQNVQVIGDSGLLVDVFMREECDVIFRGIRDSHDANVENEQMSFHAKIYPSIGDRMVPLRAKAHLRHISSSRVKLAASYHLDVSDVVPAFVQERLQQKLHNQHRIGLTGSIATGKTFVASRLTKILNERGFEAHHINIDQLMRDLYAENTRGAQKIRNALAERFGQEVLSKDRKDVLLTELKANTFDKQEAMHWTSELTRPHIERKLREALNDKCGVIIIEWAQLAEMNLGHLVNHHGIIVNSIDRSKFAKMRGLKPKQLTYISNQQLSTQKKAEALQQAAQTASTGSVVIHSNVFRENANDVDKDLEELIQHITTLFRLTERSNT
jgi:pantetheine-phosphate adenylyltransferase